MSKQPNVIRVLPLMVEFRKDKEESRSTKKKRFCRYVKNKLLPIVQEHRYIIINFDDVDQDDKELYVMLADLFLTFCVYSGVDVVKNKISLENSTDLVIENIENYYEFLKDVYKIKENFESI